MFCDGAGRRIYPGKTVVEKVWEPAFDRSLPSWLTTIGTSPVVSYAAPGAALDVATQVSGLGSAKFATKTATPTSGDQAGFRTTDSINFAAFEEVSWILYGHVTDAVSSATDNQIEISANVSEKGFYCVTDYAGTGATLLKVYPTVNANNLPYDLYKAGSGGAILNARKRKSIGFVVRPRTRDFFFCAGDPYEGAGVIYHSDDEWLSPITPILAKITTRTAEQRAFNISKVKLRLVSN